MKAKVVGRGTSPSFLSLQHRGHETLQKEDQSDVRDDGIREYQSQEHNNTHCIKKSQ